MSSKIPPRPAVRDHRSTSTRETSRERVRDHREPKQNASAGRTVADLRNLLSQRRYGSGWEQTVRQLVDLFPKQNHQPTVTPFPKPPSPPTMGIPERYPVGDPGYSPPTMGIPERYPQVGDPGFTLPDNMEKFPTITPGDGNPVTCRPVTLPDLQGELSKLQGPISGEQMGNVIMDTLGMPNDLQKLQQWAKENEAQLSPAGKMALNAYFEISEGARARGASGLNTSDLGALKKRLSAAALADGLE